MNELLLKSYALQALSCLDLTSLNDADTRDDIAALCARATTRWGSVAAVCVGSKWAALARSLLPAEVAVAAVANFPSGDGDEVSVLREVEFIVNSRAQEIDVVLPYRRLKAGDERFVAAFLQTIRHASRGLKLKVILESGELVQPEWINRAACLSLEAGADFLKTSTGRTAVGATPMAARLLLEAINRDARFAGHVGFKASGGIRKMPDAIVYMDLIAEILGQKALLPSRFRLGASSLLNDIEMYLLGDSHFKSPHEGAY